MLTESAIGGPLALVETATASESTSMRARSISTCPSRNSMPGVRQGTCLLPQPLDTCPSTSEASNRCRRERTVVPERK